MVLPAGTYVFRLLDYTADTNLVEVRSADEQKVYAIIRTIPDYRVNTKDDTSIVFGERYAGSPQIIKEWFFPDMHYGHEFVYPKTQLAALARMNANKPAESAEAQPAAQPAAQPMKEEPAAVVAAEQPKQEIQPAEAQSPEQPQQEAKAQEPQQAPPESATVTELPKTASLLPLTGLIGMLLLGGAFGLRLFSKPD